MPKASRSGSDKLAALLAEIEAAAYARGKADARRELLDLLGAGRAGAPRARASRGRRGKTAAAPRRRARGGKRAPRGSVPRFVERVLRERPGLTPPEILACAATDMERLIRLPSIRTELSNGRGQGRYELNGGRWSLPSTAPDAGESDETAPPGAAPGSETGAGKDKSPLEPNS